MTYFRWLTIIIAILFLLAITILVWTVDVIAAAFLAFLLFVATGVGYNLAELE